MPTITQIHADLEVRGCRAMLLLNDIPVMTIGSSHVLAQRLPVEQFIVPGGNRLEVVVEPGSTPSRARTEGRIIEAKDLGKEPRVSGKLVRFQGEFEHGQKDMTPTIDDPEVLTAVLWEWPLDDTGRAFVTFPQSLLAEVDVGATRGRWRWQDAPPLTLDETLRAEVSAFLREVEEAFRGQREDVMWELSRQQSEDLQRCYPGLTEEFLRRDLGNILAHYHRGQDPVLMHDPKALDLHLCAKDRLVNVVDRDWSASFRLRDPDDSSVIDVPMFLARVDGRLHLVR